MWPQAIALLLVLASAPPAAQLSKYPTPEETRAELQRHCRSLTDGDNLYFGRAIIATLRERIGSGTDDPLLAGVLRARLGRDLMRLGRFEEAIAVLEEARDLARDVDPELSGRVLYTLAMAHLQLAESQNCVERSTGASCILPIHPDGLHRLTEHTRIAGDLFLAYLDRHQEDLQARWMLNLTRMLTGSFPEGVPERLRAPAGSLAAPTDFPRWDNIAPQLGIDVFDHCGGGIMEDFDGDGLLDLVSSSWDPCEPMKAFRNDGRGGFEDVTAAWGLDGQLGGLNMVHGDYDNDGMPDILVLRGAWLGVEGRMRNSLLRNDLKRPGRRFVDVTAAAGMAYPTFPTQTAAWADFDADGDLDLYVGNEATASTTDPLSLFGKTGNPYPSQLFRNNGDGTFTDVARSAGVTDRRFTKGVAWGDYDNDGDPDIYVSNIGANRLYRNNGDSTFTDVAPELGVEQPADGTFPTWFFDYDNDGHLDIFVAAYSAQPRVVSASYLGFAPPPDAGGHAVVYRNEGGRFTDVSARLGLLRPTLPMGANYGDLDNDGWLDIYLGTGLPDYDALMPNVMYRNEGGRRFEDITFAGFGHLQKGHGVAFGDLDNDGDQDLFEQMGGAFPYDAYGNALYENPGNDNAWITLLLAGRSANSFGVGARIEVRVRARDRQRSVHVLAGSGGSFGASSLRQEIGLGDADAIESLIVIWPGSGTRQTFTEVEVNRFYRVTEGEERLEEVRFPRLRLRGEGAHRHAHDAGATG